jgi:GrpB-like predicted nucleotidyltransferase (UPF0157 family)
MPLRIRPYDPEWAARYATERVLLEEAIGAWAVGGIHHVGSTAVPGIDAHPVIDILAGIAGLPFPVACTDRLAGLCYESESLVRPDRHALCKPHLGSPVFELHLVPITSPRFAEMLAFRDLLRSNYQVAIGYAGMKRDLACRHARDPRAYAAAKGELIEAILAMVC